jgi:hypothetical protein
MLSSFGSRSTLTGTDSRLGSYRYVQYIPIQMYAVCRAYVFFDSNDRVRVSDEVQTASIGSGDGVGWVRT